MTREIRSAVGRVVRALVSQMARGGQGSKVGVVGLLLLLVVADPGATEEWPTNEWQLVGPLGGQVFGMALAPQSPASLYVAMQHSTSGVFRTQDAANHWSLVNIAAARSIAVDAADARIVYWASCNQLVRSLDGGANPQPWQQFVTGGLPPVGCARNLLVTDPAASGVVYFVIGSTQGIFKSVDYGANWTTLNVGLSDLDVTALRVAPMNSQLLFAGTSHGEVFASDDGGATWSSRGVLGANVVTSIAVDALASTKVWAVVHNVGVFRSADGGTTWVTANDGLPTRSVGPFVAADPSRSGVAYVGLYGDGLFKTIDAGASWSRVFADGVPFAMAIDPAAPQTLYVGTYSQLQTGPTGVYKSTDGGLTWVAANAGISAHLVDASAVDAQASVYVLSRGQGLFKSIDSGANWTPLGSATTQRAARLALHPTDSATLYVAGAGLYKSQDSGMSWAPVHPAAFYNVYNVAIERADPQVVYVGTPYGIFRSDDGGQAWQRIFPAEAVAYPGKRHVVAVDPLQPTHLWAGVGGEGIYRSEDRGGTWVLSNDGLPGALVASGPTLIEVTHRPAHRAVYVTSGQGLFASLDGGVTWAELPALLNRHVAGLAFDPLDDAILYVAGVCNQGVVRSADRGQTAARVDGLLNCASTMAVDPLHPNKLYTGGLRGGAVPPQGASVYGLTLAPIVDGLDPNSGAEGAEVRIHGRFFRPQQGTGRVRLGALDMLVLEWSDGEILARVPVGAQTGTVQVTVLGSPSNASVLFTVTPTNHPPLAHSQMVTTLEDTPVALTLTASDPDGDALAFAIVSPPVHGTLSGTASEVIYSPLLDYAGSDSFTFEANDGTADSNVANVSLTVVPANDRPTAYDQSVTTAFETTVPVMLAASDPDGDALTYVVVTPPSHGTLTGSGAQLAYTPSAGYSGADSLEFKATDGWADSNVATVTFTVNAPTNLPPDCAHASPSVAVLWPPNHKLRLIALQGVADPEGHPVTITVTGVTQDESVNGLGDGDTSPDAVLAPLQLRAERSGTLNGRVYHVFFLASDGHGGECTGTVKVCVPRDQAQGFPCVDEGGLYSATQR